jgi:hypothetical protein
MMQVVFRLLLVLLLDSSKRTGATTVTNDAVIWRFTARDFVQAACYPDYATLAQLWDYSANLTTTNPYNFDVDNDYRDYPVAGHSGWRGNDSDYCPIWNDIADGKFIGHPDFETSTQIYGEGCSGYKDVLTSPENGGLSCFSLDPTGRSWSNITKIIEDYLEFDESGIPKPVYCTDPHFKDLGDMRCGIRLRPTLPHLAATSGRDSFHVWYRDSPQYNLRVGFRLNLTLNGSTGNYVFDSKHPDPSLPFNDSAPLLSFHPMNQFAHAKPCLATGLRLDCSNGGRILPFSNLHLKDERAINLSYGFTVESHFFFDFEGNETFTFSGGKFWLYAVRCIRIVD